MDVTKDIIIDLLPAYFSGEASAATKALVDEFLSGDPVFAERVRREWADPLGTGAAAAPVAQSVELKSLQRTQRMLSLQRWLFALGLTFCLLPLSFSISTGPEKDFHFLIRDYPGVLVPLLGAGAICWLLYARLRRRVGA